jgi:hypothetical protein
MPPKQGANPAAAKAAEAKPKPKKGEAEKLLAAGKVDAAAAAIAKAELEKRKAKKKKKKAKSDQEANGCLVVLGTLVVLFMMLGAGCAASGKLCSKAYVMISGSFEIAVNERLVEGEEVEAAPYEAKVGAVQLTGATFARAIVNKGAFVKFLAPW